MPVSRVILSCRRPGRRAPERKFRTRFGTPSRWRAEIPVIPGVGDRFEIMRQGEHAVQGVAPFDA
jgi:hypothetical protein